MARSHLRHTHFHFHDYLQDKAVDPVPIEVVADAVFTPLPDLVRRNSAPSSTCGANDDTGACQKPVQQSAFTIPIACGIVVPIVFAMILLLILHRRHVKKLRREDAMDKHKSLDFGMNAANGRPGRTNKRALQSDAMLEKSLHRGRGMSMDLGTPYLLPPGLQSSHESLHSMSRTIDAAEDPYKPATTYFPSDASIRSFPTSRRGGDDSSSYTASINRGYKQDSSTHNLIQNAQRMSRSQPPTHRSSAGSLPGPAQLSGYPPTHGVPRKGLPSTAQDELQLNQSVPQRDSYKDKDGADGNNTVATIPHGRQQSVDQAPVARKPANETLSSTPSDSQHNEGGAAFSPSVTLSEQPSRPPRKQSLPVFTDNPKETSPFTNHFQTQTFEERTPNPYEFDEDAVPSSEFENDNYPPGPHELPAHIEMPEFPDDTPLYMPDEMEHYSSQTSFGANLGYDDRSMSNLRPLPPDEPNDNPEQRANRIRSFYKEYFNESEPARTYAPGPETYYEDYDQEYQADGAVIDPASGHFIVAQAPYAQPITRRAMTPPPPPPPRFQETGRHQHNASSPSFMTPAARSRAQSSASTSGRFGPQMRGPPKRALPPPKPLRNLPTPHLLQEDAFAIPIDFAPPTRYKDRQAGRPDSPFMELRPYSPSLSHNPLASAFDELPSMPSPYQLRKSGAFTALDFAPPPRFKKSDGGSDAGSIRSGRSTGSAMSAVQKQSIRAGAYRVSRIPKDIVGTKDEITNSLRPQWDLGRPS